MLRVALTIVLPLLVPTAVYLLWMRLARPAEAGIAPTWAAMPWLWLAGAGAALLASVLVAVTVHYGTQQPGVYVPPRWEQGRVIPSHIEPGPRP